MLQNLNNKHKIDSPFEGEEEATVCSTFLMLKERVGEFLARSFYSSAANVASAAVPIIDK